MGKWIAGLFSRRRWSYSMSRLLLPLTALGVVLCLAGSRAAEPPSPEKPAPKAPAVEQVAVKVRPSVVVITSRGRGGKREGLGTGFVVSADGLIATNLHVIGEGRAVTVELADGKRYPATAVHASDRKLDLAVIRIDAQNLTPLELGDSSLLKDGQAVVAMGNPQGLKHSVVAGVLSGKRDIDGRPMLQVAIPIEPGNSGGPLVDMQGRVHGIMTIKSLVTDNLGFAVAVNSLKPLLRKPNPVPMSAWLTLGALDPDEWKPRLGANWRQRAGRITVDGFGSGFGGRSLCLSQKQVPDLPYEVGVSVRLDNEAGAAGLIFHADGGDRHYGFYPSGGQLRLTCFNGPDVFSWKILKQEASPHYRPGAWNALKVRLEKECIRCYVNDHEVFAVADTTYTQGRAGLAKFRDTVAEFKHFRVARRVPPSAPPADVAARVARAVEGLPAEGPPKPEVVERLEPEGPATTAVLRERAQLLERQAARLRQLAQAVHQRRVLAELQRVLRGKEEDIDLLHAALLIARLDNEDVDVDDYRDEVARMAHKVAAGLPPKADDRAKLEALNRYLFRERGFHGSRSDYYNRSNSYLSEVIDDREGIPITLSVLYIELGRRLGLKIEGVSLPGHFVVRHVPAKGKPQLIDAYEGGQVLSREEAASKVKGITGRALREEHLTPVPRRKIVVRMLSNLLNVADQENDAAGMLRYVDAILAVEPDAAQERALRVQLRYQAGDRAGALQDIDWLLDHRPEGLDVERVQEMRRRLSQPEK
jgi:regulator of sirC expression with transglutaminase-like and TPR domain/S1-C subfamily serine protease